MQEDLFYKWTQNLTRGSSISFQKVPLTEAHLSPLLKVKGFSSVVKELILRVRPANECQHIRLNLHHSSMRKRAREGRSTNELQNACTWPASSIKNTREEVAVEAQELKRLVEKEEELIREEEELRRQIALLHVAVEDMANRTKSLKQWTEEVDQLLPQFSHSSSWEDDATKQEAVNEELKIILDKLKTLKLHLSNEDKILSDNQMEMWPLIEALLKRHRPSFIMKALSLVTLKETAAISDSIQAIDLIADAKALRLKYCRGGELVDELRPEEMLETVESMLVEMSGKHIKGHFRNQRKLQEIRTAVDSLKNVMNMVHSVAEELYSDPSDVSEVMVLCNVSLKVAGLKATLATASKVIQDLKSRGRAAAQQGKAVMEKDNRIHHFNEQVENTVSDLQFLSFEASQHLESLKEIKVEIASIVEEGLSSLSFPTPFLKRSFSKEAETVLELPIEALRSSPTEVGFAPILPLGLIDRPYSSLDGVSTTFPYITSWDNIIDVIRRKKFHLRQHEDVLSQKINNLKMITALINEHALSTTQVKELCQKAKSQDYKLETQILPLLDECQKSQEEMEQWLEQLRSSIEEWWNQPGPVIINYLKQKSA